MRPQAAFRLGALIGQGGMGRVYAAEHIATGLLAAIKTLDLHPDRAGALAAAFEAEAALAASLDHPHVVPILDYGVGGLPGLPEGSPYLVMVRATGTLSSVLGALDWPALRRVLVETLEALAHAHARGVLHCDVKPSNVLLGVRRHARQPMASTTAGLALTDFGLARRLGDAERPRGGTRDYMAPEQHQPDGGSVGPWTDLYGLGGLAWALATGAPPAPEEPFVPRMAVPERFEGWVRRLLALDPAMRFARASEAAEALPLGAPTPAPAPQARAAPTTEPTQAVVDVRSVSTLARPARTPTAAATPRPRAARVPDDWRTAAPTWPSPTLQDAGLGVWRLRPPPLVGREAERDALWAALKRVASTGRPAGVVVTGPPGVGLSRLLDWIRQRAHEVASAEVATMEGPPWAVQPATDALQVITLDDAEGLGSAAPELAERLGSAGPTDRTLWVMAVHATAEAALPAPWEALRGRVHVIDVEPLHPADAEALARSALHLAPELVLHLAAASEGFPRRLMDDLSRWASTGQMEPTSSGFRRRAGAGAAPAAAGRQAPPVEVLIQQAEERITEGRLREGAALVAGATSAADHRALPPDHRLRAELAALRLRLDPSAMDPDERGALARHVDGWAEEQGWGDLQSEALSRLAVTASNQGRPQEGRTLVERAVALADAHGAMSQRILGRLYLGHMHLLLGDPDAAREAFDAIADLAPGHPNPDQASTCAHLGLSILHRRSQRWDEAEHHAERALEIARAAGLALDQAKALRALGACHARGGHFDRAAEIWQTCVALARDLGLTSDLPHLYTDLGESLRQLGRPVEAERAFHRALAGLRPGDGADVIGRMNLARLYVDADRFAEAWQLVGPDGVEVADIGWKSLRPQLLTLRAAAAAGIGARADAEAALALVEHADVAALRTDPTMGELLELAARLCTRAGWGDLATHLGEVSSATAAR